MKRAWMMTNILKGILFSSILIASCNIKQESSCMEEFINNENITPLQKKEWVKLVSDWEKNVAKQILNRYNLNKNCSQCSDLLFKIDAYVDNHGKMYNFKVLSAEIYCQQVDSIELNIIRKELIESFANLRMPISFQEHRIKLLVGTPTKC